MSEKHTFYAYLDGFDELTIIIPVKHHRDNAHFHLIGNDEEIVLDIIEKHHIGDEIKLIATFDAYIDLKTIYHVRDDEGHEAELRTGKIVRTRLFDNIYHYDRDDLGMVYAPEGTKFKIWSPVAKSIDLELVKPDGGTTMHAMRYKNAGVWRLYLEGDYEGYRYRYHVYVNEKTTTVRDPYAIASTTNGAYAYVIDREKTRSMDHAVHFSGDPTDAVIYEISVRDFSMDPAIDFEHRGKFLGVAEAGRKTPKGHPAGLDHLVSLGITHVQIMPFFDFRGIDEENPEEDYNWGYNPSQYFVPEGSYATDPDDPYTRIDELKQMIDTLHEKNIGVIMDVVFNHVYDAEEFPYEKLVPGYAFQVDRQGIYTDVSGCSNDLATHRKMMRKLIIDACLYYVREFHVDGFRFDLMGLIDVETMNELRQKLHDESEHILVYGEGWKMHQTNVADRMAHMDNKSVLYTIGFFNDAFREAVKGSTFTPEEPGYASGHPGAFADQVKELIRGSAHKRYRFKYASQSINYVECHDNQTFYDKMTAITDDVSLRIAYQQLATAMVVLSQGVPFLHAGQEFFRSKNKDENSYDAGDHINMVRWHHIDRHDDAVDHIRRLIAIRRNMPCFNLKSHSDMTKSLLIEKTDTHTIIVRRKDDCPLILVFKPGAQKETITIGRDYDLAYRQNQHIERQDDETFVFDGIGAYVFIRKGSEQPWN